MFIGPWDKTGRDDILVVVTDCGRQVEIGEDNWGGRVVLYLCTFTAV
jgi:hypothetical protein